MNQRSDIPNEKPRLRAAALQFGITPGTNLETSSRIGAQVEEVISSLETTLILLEDGATRLCLITTHFGPGLAVNESELFRQTIAQDLDLPKSHVLIFSSHNHSCVDFSSNGIRMYESYGKDDVPPAQLWPIGEEFLAALRAHAAQLPAKLEPVTVSWAEGHEDRITYNRKGRREDGTSYLMREEDRELLGPDFSGEIDTQAPIVVFKNEADQAVAVLTQFTGHPVTSYHPEKPVVFGEWPQIAAEKVAEYFKDQPSVPVGFLQGCAANINSKEMLSGNVELATQFGHMLGQCYIDALENLQLSKHDGLDVVIENVGLPLASLPTKEVLIAELEEIDAFIERANSGDEDTLSCVGQNYPKALSPKYRASLANLIRVWNVWALELYDKGGADSLPDHLEMEVAVIRIGDVGIVGLPFEPFQEIGRQIRRGSSLPLSIPCGYMNVSHGYITDSSNIEGQEYMSSHYRYTRFRAPLKSPAGDVFAEHAVRVLNQFSKEAPHGK